MRLARDVLRWLIPVTLLVLAVPTLWMGQPSSAQALVATIPVGFAPIGVGVNPVTNRLFVGNENDVDVSVIDTVDNTALPPIFVGGGAQWVAVNSAANRVYVVTSDNMLRIIDGTMNAVVASVPVPPTCCSFKLAVNETTNRVYIVGGSTNALTVIDGLSGAVLDSLTLTPLLVGVRVNSTTNRVYVLTVASVLTLDGSTDAVLSTLPLSFAPQALGLNPSTNRLYITHGGEPGLTVVDAASNSIVTTIADGAAPGGSDVGVNPTTNRVYTAGIDGGMSVVNGATNAVVANVSLPAAIYGIGVNPLTNRVYASDVLSSRVFAVDDSPVVPTATRAPASPTPSPTATLTPTSTIGPAASATATPSPTGTSTPVPTPDPFNRISVFLQSATGGFQPGVTLPNPAGGFGAVGLAVGDVAGDGHARIAAVGQTDSGGGALVLYTAQGSGSFSAPSVVATGANPVALSAATVSQVGTLDLAIAESGSANRVEVFHGARLQDPPDTFPLPGAPSLVAVGRLTDDALPDLAVGLAGSTSVQVLRQAPSPAGTPVPLLTTDMCELGSVPRALSLGRSNLATNGAVDNDPDLFALLPGSVSIRDNPLPGGSAFCAPGGAIGSLTAGTDPVALTLADVNGDGRTDVIVLNRGDGTVSTFFASSTPGTYEPPVTSPVGINPVGLATITLAGSGVPGLAVVHAPSRAPGGGPALGQLTVLAGAANGSFSILTAIPLRCSPTPKLAVQAGDLNGDGRGDIVLAGCLPPDTVPIPTPTTAPIGGRDLGLQGGSPVQMSWLPGLQQTGYLVIRWGAISNTFDFFPSPAAPLPGTQTSFADSSTLTDAAYCYLLLIEGGVPPSTNNVLGISDFLCLYPNTHSGTTPPGQFTARLDDGTQASLSWSAPGGQTAYDLLATRFDGSPPRTISLLGSQTSFVDDPSRATTCYQLTAKTGSVPLGTTDRVCTAPGVSSLGTAGAMGSVTTLEQVAGALQRWLRP